MSDREWAWKAVRALVLRAAEGVERELLAAWDNAMRARRWSEL